MENLAQWGDFEVHFDGVLGRGGMGTVYRAWQRSVGRWVAVKVLDASREPDPELQEGVLQKFQVEIQALARLSDPRIVTIYQAGDEGGRLWFAMELIDGVTVEQRLSEKGAFTEKEAAAVGVEVARALDAALRQGIVHRDVKPANVFLLKDGSVKLADFGLARSAALARTRLTDLNAVACTPEYASPEQADGRSTDHRSDLYSLGCVLYEMVTERPPFSAGSQLATLYKQASEPAPSPRLLNPRVSPAFETVIERCLRKNPEDRYQSYSELIEALVPPPSSPALPTARTSARRDWLWPAATAAGVTLLGVILAAIFTSDAPLPPPASAAVPVEPPRALEPLRIPRSEPPPPAPEKKKAAEPPEPPPAPAPKEKLDPKKEIDRAASEALASFRASLSDEQDLELVGQIPWGTWVPDTFHAPGGEARFDDASKAIALAARGPKDLVLVKRPFTGARAGYQARFRRATSSVRFVVMLSTARWIEIGDREAALLRSEGDGAVLEEKQDFGPASAASVRVTVVPSPGRVFVFLEDRLLFAVAETEDPPARGVQIGAKGGLVLLESVRVKDRSR